jgi:hypothetical protein
MPQRTCTKTPPDVARPHKSITIPLAMEQYNAIVDACHAYRKGLDDMIMQHPALFPKAISAGDRFHDDRGSATLAGVCMRRMRLHVPTTDGTKHACAQRSHAFQCWHDRCRRKSLVPAPLCCSMFGLARCVWEK